MLVKFSLMVLVFAATMDVTLSNPHAVQFENKGGLDGNTDGGSSGKTSSLFKSNERVFRRSLKKFWSFRKKPCKNTEVTTDTSASPLKPNPATASPLKSNPATASPLKSNPATASPLKPNPTTTSLVAPSLVERMNPESTIGDYDRTEVPVAHDIDSRRCSTDPSLQECKRRRTVRHLYFITGKIEQRNGIMSGGIEMVNELKRKASRIMDKLKKNITEIIQKAKRQIDSILANEYTTFECNKFYIALQANKGIPEKEFSDDVNEILLRGQLEKDLIEVIKFARSVQAAIDNFQSQADSCDPNSSCSTILTNAKNMFNIYFSMTLKLSWPMIQLGEFKVVKVANRVTDSFAEMARQAVKNTQECIRNP